MGPSVSVIGLMVAAQHVQFAEWRLGQCLRRFAVALKRSLERLLQDGSKIRILQQRISNPDSRHQQQNGLVRDLLLLQLLVSAAFPVNGQELHDTALGLRPELQAARLWVRKFAREARKPSRLPHE